jgi:TolA-binding protein
MKYWVYMNGEVPGSYSPQELAALNGFSMTSLVCPAEGEILEKNWRRSGEFPDIIKILHERDAKMPPSAPALAQEAVMTGDVNKVIDTASARLFTHVSTLMKELENRREEKALTLTLQRQVVELQDKFQDAQGKIDSLEGRLAKISELEESVRKDLAQIQSLESALKAREEGLSELRLNSEKIKFEMETTKRRLGESLNDLSIRNRLVDKLSRDLTEKELSLAKSLGVIRRLEEDLNRLCPIVDTLPVTAAAPVDKVETKEEVQPLEPVAPVESAEAPVESVPAADLPPVDQPAAQGALVKKLGKFFSRYDH